jgi:hypothetical protein
MLDEHSVLEHSDLGQVVGLAYEHEALDGLATRQELGLGQDRGPTASGCATLTPALPLRLHARRTFDAGDLVDRRTWPTTWARLADTYDDLCRVVLGRRGVLAATTTTTASTAACGDGLVAVHHLGVVDIRFSVRLRRSLTFGIADGGFVRVGIHVIRSTATAPATATTTTTTRRVLAVHVVRGVLVKGFGLVQELGLVLGLSISQRERLVLVLVDRLDVVDDLGDRLRQRSGDGGQVD